MSTTKSSDIEAATKPKEFLEGYADLAEYIVSDEDLSVYRRFCSLSARNLLYLQAELQVLEAQLRNLDKKCQADIENGGDLGEKMEILQAAKDWESFVRKANFGDERQLEKMKIVMEIRRVMKEYRKLIRSHSFLPLCLWYIRRGGITVAKQGLGSRSPRRTCPRRFHEIVQFQAATCWL